MRMADIQQAADKVTSDLMQYGMAGTVLAVFVAPVLFVLVKSAQRRDEERIKQDADDRKRQNDREDRLVLVLQQSVEQQRQALELQRQFEVNEQGVHQALAAALREMSDRQQVNQAQQSTLLAEICKNLSETTRVLRGIKSEP